MRILYFIDSLKVGGAEVLLRNLAAGILAAGHEIHVGYCTPGPLQNDFQRMGIPLYRLLHRGRVDPFLLLRMYQLVRRLRPDIVHTHLFKSDFHGRLAGRVGGAGRVLSTLHSADPWAARFPLGRVYGATARFADVLMAVSDEVKAYHIRMTGVPPEKVIRIANGIDMRKFAARPEVGSQFRAQFNIPSDVLLLGAVGRLVPDKGHRDFLEAAALIAESHPGAWFILVGDGPLRASLEQQAEAAGIRSRVVFTGLLEDIPAAMQALDVLVFSSRREGLPLTLLEGMAASKPVVATDVGGIGGVLENGASGWLVPANDAPALAQACLRLIEAPAQIAQMGQAARQRVETEYTLERMVAQTLQLYTKPRERAKHVSKVSEKRGVGRAKHAPHPFFRVSPDNICALTETPMSTKKLHILEIGKSTAGVGEYLRWLAAGLDKAQFALTFACMSAGGEALAAELAQIEGVAAFSIPMNRYKIAPLSDLRALLYLRRAMRRGQFDLIHAHASKPGFMARLAAVGTGIPVIYSPHCFAFHAGAHPLTARGIAFFERLAARWLTRSIITVAHAEVDLAQRYRVGSMEQFVTIHSGIDTTPFGRPLQKAAVRGRLGIPPNVPLVGAVGRMSRQKNPLLFVRAAAQIHARHPQAHFVWIGDGPLMAAAKSLAMESGLEESVHFPGNRDDIPGLLGIMDVFVLSSDWEAFPLTLLEAMAARLPVVATAVMGVPEIVIPGETGLLTPPNDAPALAEAIIQLLADPGRSKSMGACGRQHVESAFSRQQMIGSIAEAYQRTVA